MKRITIVLMMLITSLGFLQAQLNQINLPVNFEGSTTDYTLTDFGDNSTTLGLDPANAANTVAITTKAVGAASWAGTTMGTEIGFASKIPFTETETKISVMVYSPAAGIPVLLKAEDHKDVTLTAETFAYTTVANAWEKLTFDFSDVAAGTNPFHLTTNFDKLSIFFNKGFDGAGKVYYWDDVIFMAAAASDDASLSEIQIDGNKLAGFVSTTLNYTSVLPYGTTVAPKVTAKSSNASAKIEISDAAAIPGTASIVVTSVDNTTTLTYTIAFSAALEPSADASLSDLLIDGKTISGFEPTTFEYNISLPATANVPTVTATSTNLASVIEIIAATALPGTTSVNVTAQDGSTRLSYTVAFSTSSHSLPITFESGAFAFQDFDGGTATVIANPQSSGINTSTTVAQIVRDGGATWAGSKLILDEKIDFSVNNTFSMKVYSPKAGLPVLFKLEGENAATEVNGNTTVANQWETLTWDFTGTASNTFDALVFMFDFGKVGDGSASSTFLFDDVELFDITGGLSQIDLPLDFESSDVFYEMTDFEGGSTILVADPTDATNTVAKTTREAGTAPWAGTTMGTSKGFASRIPFTASQSTLSLRVYSPAAGIPILLKAEDHNDVTKTAETFASTTVANAWETLNFDFSNVAPGTNPFNPDTFFDKVSIMFNKGVNPTGDFYYWDDVKFGEGVGTAIQIANAENIKIYSNKGYLFVSSDNDFIKGQIEVFDITGKKTYSHTISNNQEQIAINKGGLMIVRVSDAMSKKVIAKNIIIE